MALSIRSFTAIDFETAQGPWWSICQVGLVRVENLVITDQFETYVKPPDNRYTGFNINLHGITPSKTALSPTFSEVWQKLRPYIQNQDVVAHKASFDCGCLQQALQYYNLTFPPFRSHCTYKIYGEALAALCKKYGISLNHHNALSDATACAKLFILYLKGHN